MGIVGHISDINANKDQSNEYLLAQQASLWNQNLETIYDKPTHLYILHSFI
jgi:hypothetical protein